MIYIHEKSTRRLFNYALSLIVTLFSLFTTVHGQTKNVSGKVTDKDGGAMAGVTITVKGQQRSTVSDVKGSYDVSKVHNGDKLVFSLVGYETEEVEVGSQSQIDVQLISSFIDLGEAVVIGYGSLEKRQVTSSITSIRGDKLPLGLGGATIATALRGKVPGLTIDGTSSPNATNSFQLRGVASVHAGQGPLVVIDGIPGGDIRAISQEDIETIDVLKDASAGAIYGTRAAGGVILITTKQAKAGEVKIQYSGEFSTEQIRKRPDLLSSSEYVIYGLGQDYGYDTDWYSALTNDRPFSHRQVVSLSGGSPNALVYTTFSTQNQKGIVIGDGRKDYSGRINSKFSMFDNKVEIQARAEYRQAQRDQRNGSGSFNTAMMLNPTIPIYNDANESGYNVREIGISGTSNNPVADIMLKTYDGKDSWLLSDASLKINLSNNLSVKGTIGYQESKWQLYRYTSPHHKSSVDNSRRGEGYHGFSKNNRFSTDAYLNYKNIFNGDHNVDAIAGYSFWEANGESFNMTNYNFTIDGVGPWNMEDGTWLTDGRALMDSEKSPRERLLSMFSRINYTFKDKYILSASYRREGSSKFGPNHRWGNFWAVSGGWRMIEEDFIKNIPFISDLKLRAGYGVTGNNSFGNGYATRMYSPDSQMYPTPGGEWIYAYGPQRNVNANLKWEEKGELNVGLDFGFWNNRLFGKLDVYKRRVKDLLFETDAPTPPMTHTTIMRNVGTLENRGWEFELGSEIVRNTDWNYNTVARLSHNTSKILDLGEDGVIDMDAFPSPGNPGRGGRLGNNSTIGQFFVFKYAGLDEYGKWLIYDKNGDVVPGGSANLINENKYHVGNAIPKLTVSWDHNLSYKQFDFSLSLRSYINYDVFSQINMYYGLRTQSQFNVLREAFDRYAAVNDEKILSDVFISDATFLALDAISAGYTFDLKKYTPYVSKAKLYFSSRDLFVWSAYKGVNPQVNLNGLFPGFEQINTTASMYPQTRRFTLGVQLTF
ncbi:TonB-linked outer membrane protein, SusC/RagA family [Sphingobacterium nematocida]|uniref:TonB-linked outer membrane protein, SusC/RagA family n=1 Tax=Sphingobacterium nematocida TaxID=1513896 RepID=A0A1T5CZ27_9SPHI|nr:SusC/RagA family TonB-linked outer membrane protein [Sphingobacterium nematocida]SKB64649.1 TonB-linked outer membrane protein, SusC/RagA family [Sphingobacterium nematocida]